MDFNELYHSSPRLNKLLCCIFVDIWVGLMWLGRFFWVRLCVPQNLGNMEQLGLRKSRSRDRAGRCRNCSWKAFSFFFFWPHRAACGILVPQPGIEPRPLAVEAQSPNHWTAGEVPLVSLLICLFFSTSKLLSFSSFSFKNPNFGLKWMISKFLSCLDSYTLFLIEV